MKKYARSIVTSILAFGIIAYFYPGFNYHNNYITLLLSAAIFALLTIFVKPILKIFSLPFNLITFGLFSFFINIILLYAVSYFVPDFKIIAFHFSGYTISGFNFPPYDLSQLMSALVASVLIGIFSTCLHWIFK